MKRISIDFWCDFIKSPYSDEMEKKYWHKLDVSVDETVKYLLKNNLAYDLIKDVFYGDVRDSQTPYLLKVSENKFEVFESERGAKFGLHTYSNLEDALFDYVDTVYNSYGIVANDSKINS